MITIISEETVHRVNEEWCPSIDSIIGFDHSKDISIMIESICMGNVRFKLLQVTKGASTLTMRSLKHDH